MSRGVASFSTNQSSTQSSTRSILGACNLNVGNVYKRTSGKIYVYGTVGVKPTITCDTTMQFLSLTTNLYKAVWWGLQLETGPVTTTGSLGNTVTSKSVEKICASLQMSTFYAIVTTRVTFVNGSVSGGDAYETATLPCGTP